MRRKPACEDCKFWGFSDEHFPMPDGFNLPVLHEWLKGQDIAEDELNYCVLTITDKEQVPGWATSAFALGKWTGGGRHYAGLVTSAEFGCLRFMERKPQP